ncbi:tRNA (adenosine(37)-N6)-threonylcarbamoyltransferase complex transferase subunit TsaD [Candidatus Roizmanbacteria bacterium CG10_big_fil_rev_8_21_14_0_10_39_6]|uniref:tRNA N6-adenosine threonylcarbamoyltransferase n=1 Tax=Candidatus Roizmanbacteria bacterium CG10_big_fil_rev_8_21_14_0_10_39_6 TaxID=1974853 RepID=A0A2M8KTR1_9BACT|nr:MAG: tRNA (adenosine(37)-N6)-threonylcarbamoyltransferase complex transferase subunit TsaD [Candidatus Roizmanbacteria bacterium CG10_big_fil_rev_8_21_14_0_10_39_6]
MNILAIDTSADETSVAITNKQRVLSSVIFSQISVHKPYGGVFPSLAKREHYSKITPAIELAMKKAYVRFNDIKAIAVTIGPGLPPALEVGVSTAKLLSLLYKKPLIPVDHIEGHIYSPFVQNKNGNPKREFLFPFLALVVSGGHTQLVIVKSHIRYQILGSTLDDAAGEALDKAGRMLGLGYPAGPAIEQFAENGNVHAYTLPIPMKKLPGFDFSYSGLKTAFKHVVYSMSEKERVTHIHDLAASFQNAVFQSLLLKLERVLKTRTDIPLVVLGGGVSANKTLRQQFRSLVRKYKKQPLTVAYPYLSGDNAAMIGTVAWFKYERGIVLKDAKAIQSIERIPRANLSAFTIL